MTNDRPVRDAVSAGGVVWRKDAAGLVEVLLCGRTAEKLWGLPKGTPDAGETTLETAVREVQEETGLLVQPGEKIGTISYWFSFQGTRIHKQVHHWLMMPTGGDIADHDHEFDAVEWFDADTASRKLTYENERRILADAVRILAAPS